MSTVNSPIPNQISTADLCTAFDQEFIENFRNEYDRFEEILGIFPSETMHAGAALYLYSVTGELVDTDGKKGGEGTDKDDDAGTGSSGSKPFLRLTRRRPVRIMEPGK